MLSFCVQTVNVGAAQREIVKVAAFPMTGFYEIDDDGTRFGMEVELLNEIQKYTNWKIEYVDVNNFAEASALLDAKEVDFVGGVQLATRTKNKYLYGDIACGHFYNTMMVLRDSSFIYKDFAHIDYLKIGASTEYMGVPLLEEYLAAIGFENYEIIPYDSTAESKVALNLGEVDAVVGNMLEMEKEYRVLSYFKPKPFFFISYYGNENRVARLDIALTQMNMDNAGYASSLVAAYYDEFTNDDDIITYNESLYLAEKTKLKIGYLPDKFPYSYEKNGTFMGIARDVLNELEISSGLELEYINVEDMQTGSKLLESESIDLLAYYPENHGEHTDGILGIRRYAYSPYSIIIEDNTETTQIDSVAVSKDFSDIDQYFGQEIAVRVYDTEKECVEAVHKGKVYAAVVQNYTYEELHDSNYKYKNLIVYSNLDKSQQIMFAVSENAPEELIGIVRKLTDERRDTDVAQFVLSNVSMDGFIYGKMTYWGLLVLAVFAIILTFVLMLYRDSRRIRVLTSRDVELGIWNTSYFLYHSEQHIKKNAKHQYAIVYLYLSQFRVYSNIKGYDASHVILQRTLDTLREKCLKLPGEHYARSYGGRFVLLLRVEDKNHLAKRLEAIRRVLTDELREIDTSPMPICFGVCMIDPKKNDISKSAARANMAIDSLKNASAGKTIFFDESFEENMKVDYEKERILDSASSNDFVVYYQSKVDIRTEKIIGAEALVRFKDPNEDGKIKSPYFFIDYFEKNGRVCKLDFHVLNLVCKMLRRRLDNGEAVVPVSVNFSRLHFQDPNFISQLELVIDSYELPRELIELEVTETALVEEFNEDQVMEMMDEIISRGFHLSVDDFGTGYSSLSVLEQIPASVIKLDRSFFRNEKDRDRKIAILRNFVRMARELGVSVVCEGVEFDEDVELMHQIDAFIAQGYKYSQPEPEDKFEERITKQAS